MPRWAAIAAIFASHGCGAPGPVAEPRVQVTVINGLGVPICDVLMRPSEQFAAGWGNDWLDRDEIFADGARRTFALAPGQTWDVSLIDCADQTRWEISRQSFSRHSELPATLPH